MSSTNYAVEITNPFTGEQHSRHISGIEQLVEQEKFAALKDFISDQLKKARASEIVMQDPLVSEKLTFLIVQMYQPTDMPSLVLKLEKFKEWLHHLEEFKQVYAYIAPSPSRSSTAKSKEVLCKDCTKIYYVPDFVETIEETRTYCKCPYCRSHQWEWKAQADMRAIYKQPKKEQ